MNSLRMTLPLLLSLLSIIGVSSGGDASKLRKLEDEFWDWRMRISPEYSTLIGNMDYNDRLESYDPDRFSGLKEDVESFLARLRSIKTNRLVKSDQINYEVLEDTLSTFIKGYEWRNYGSLNPISFMEGIQRDPDFSTEMASFNNIGDYENFLSRLERMPKQIQEIIRSFQRAIAMGRTHHSVSVNRIPGQISRIISANYTDSLFYKPFHEKLNTLPTVSSTRRQDLREKARHAVESLNQSLTTLKNFILQEYMPNTRQGLGVSSWVGGSKYYKECLKWHLSVNMTPEEVSEIGKQEVQRIYSNMAQISQQHGFRNDVASFLNFMKNNSAFYINSPNGILRAFRELITERISPELPKYFRKIPDTPLRVIALPTDGPPAMYRGSDGIKPGTFNVNVVRPKKVPTYGMMALGLHEGVPGHHLQITYSQTVSKLPKFRKYVETRGYVRVPFLFPFYTVYSEGWGLYAESLGEEMGLYKDDFELMGRYTFEIFRASRLVVDTGIHYFNWTRERAIQYVLNCTNFDRQIVENEIDRYTTFPGQACAYKIGEIKLHQLRKISEQELGEDFDIRDFHAVVLENGALPLHLLEKIVTEWIQDVKHEKSKDASSTTRACEQTIDSINAASSIYLFGSVHRMFVTLVSALLFICL